MDEQIKPAVPKEKKAESPSPKKVAAPSADARIEALEARLKAVEEIVESLKKRQMYSR